MFWRFGRLAGRGRARQIRGGAGGSNVAVFRSSRSQTIIGNTQKTLIDHMKYVVEEITAGIHEDPLRSGSSKLRSSKHYFNFLIVLAWGAPAETISSSVELCRVPSKPQSKITR